ncbi:MAG: thiamine-phosphate kinase [Crocinitomicaceae bacterium]|jgi:thiamine-monophosphate kinase
MENKKLRDLAELGEFGLIDVLTQDFQLKNKNSIFGIGDDAAEIRINEEESLLVSTDTLVEGIHFNLMYMPLKFLGYKAVAVNVSDICAMNGKAEQITVSIAVSSRFPVEALEELYEGIHAACEHYQIDLIGGDTTSSLSGLMISITAIGRVNKNSIAYRSGAKENDLIVVSGDLGASYLGLQVLEREKEVFKTNPNIQPKLDGYDYLVGRQLKPEARIDVVDQLSKAGVIPTSMIDISDGLASELMHIAKSSTCSVSIYSEKIPFDEKTSLTAIDFNLDPITCALNGGEDYELLFTINQNDFEKIKTNPNLSVIGHITSKDSGNLLIDKNGTAVNLKAQGWKHF